MKHVLIVEDEENVHSFLRLELEYEGYQVTVCENGREGYELAQKNTYDMILLDLMLPGMNGLEVCRRIREHNSMVPIIMLTARDTVMDRITGLQLGADDYLPKPFDTQELLTRMQVIFRRMNQESKNELVLSYKDLSLDITSRRVTRGDYIVELTNKEFELLHMFLKNINRVLTREILLDQVWGYEHVVETNVVDVYIRYLRNKLNEEDKEAYIETIRGVGYVMRNE